MVQGDELGDDAAQVLAGDDPVDQAMLQREFRRLEPLGELFAHGRLDHAAPRKADERLGLGDDHVDAVTPPVVGSVMTER